MLADMTTDTSAHDRKRRRVSFFHRHIANPITRRLPTQVLLATTGRVSGQPWRTPVGGRLDGAAFWLVSDHGEAWNYVRNIKVINKGSRSHPGPLACGNRLLAAGR
jgi:hypothetical protein